jgi:hypothetical protein
MKGMRTKKLPELILGITNLNKKATLCQQQRRPSKSAIKNRSRIQKAAWAIATLSIPALEKTPTGITSGSPRTEMRAGA